MCNIQVDTTDNLRILYQFRSGKIARRATSIVKPDDIELQCSHNSYNLQFLAAK